MAKDEFKEGDVRIGTPDEAIWNRILKATEARILEQKASLELDLNALEYIKEKVEKFK